MGEIEQELKNTEVSSKDAEMIMRKLLELEGKIESNKQQIDEIKRLFEDREVEIVDRKKKVLDKYEDSKKEHLINTLWANGQQGADKDDIAQIYGVTERQARRILKKASRQYDYLEKKSFGGPKPDKLRHVIAAKIEEFQDIVDLDEDFSKSKILDKLDWNGDKKEGSLEILDDIEAHINKFSDDEEVDGYFNPNTRLL